MQNSWRHHKIRSAKYSLTSHRSHRRINLNAGFSALIQITRTPASALITSCLATCRKERVWKYLWRLNNHSPLTLQRCIDRECQTGSAPVNTDAKVTLDHALKPSTTDYKRQTEMMKGKENLHDANRAAFLSFLCIKVAFYFFCLSSKEIQRK